MNELVKTVGGAIVTFAKKLPRPPKTGPELFNFWMLAAGAVASSAIVLLIGSLINFPALFSIWVSLMVAASTFWHSRKVAQYRAIKSDTNQAIRELEAMRSGSSSSDGPVRMAGIQSKFEDMRSFAVARRALDPLDIDDWVYRTIDASERAASAVRDLSDIGWQNTDDLNLDKRVK